jgi:hypothetical protein
MNQSPYKRMSAASGAVFVVLLNAVLLAPGAPPKARDSAKAIAVALADQRGVILGGMFATGIALLFGLWFFAFVARWLSRHVQQRDIPLAWAAVGGGVLSAALVLMGTLLFYGAAFKVAREGQYGVVRGLTDVGNATIEMSKFGLALFVSGVSFTSARARLLPRWVTTAGLISATLAIASTTPLFSEASLTQFGGPIDLLGGLPAIVWMLGLSLVLARRTQP